MNCQLAQISKLGLFALLAFISCDPAYAQLPSCEAQLARARERIDQQWEQIRTCQNHEVYQIDDTPITCRAWEPLPGMFECSFHTATPPLEPVPMPEPGLGVALAIGILALLLLAGCGGCPYGDPATSDLELRSQ